MRTLILTACLALCATIVPTTDCRAQGVCARSKCFSDSICGDCMCVRSSASPQGFCVYRR